jgi:hypothetical protein
MMFEEIDTLLSIVSNPDATKEDYRKAIVDGNILMIRTKVSRMKAYYNLNYFYALDNENPIFRALKYYRNKDPESGRLNSFLCCYLKDHTLRHVMDYLNYESDTLEYLYPQLIANEIDIFNDQYSKKTLEFLSYNIFSTLRQAGYLDPKGEYHTFYHNHKLKRQYHRKIITPKATYGNVAFALYLGYLNGVRGVNLFTTKYMHLLCLPQDCQYLLAETAHMRELITFKKIGNIMEISFPSSLNVLK